jgi:hypothetical protein
MAPSTERVVETPTRLLANQVKLVASGLFADYADRASTGEQFRIWKSSKCYISIQVGDQKVRKFRIRNGNGVDANANLMAYLREICEAQPQGMIATA